MARREPIPIRRRRIGLPACAFCGIQPDNGAGIQVTVFNLRERRLKSAGQLAICERCLAERARGAAMVTSGFRTEARA